MNFLFVSYTAFSINFARLTRKISEHSIKTALLKNCKSWISNTACLSTWTLLPLLFKQQNVPPKTKLNNHIFLWAELQSSELHDKWTGIRTLLSKQVLLPQEHTFFLRRILLSWVTKEISGTISTSSKKSSSVQDQGQPGVLLPPVNHN